MILRKASEHDLPEILEIYNESVANSLATFETETQTLDSRRHWFDSHCEIYPLIVAEEGGRVLGYSSLSGFQSNCGYRKTAELSVYVEKNHRGKGIGASLLTEILYQGRRLGFHAVISSISTGNNVSIKLHEKFGFEKVAHLKEVGFKFGEWHDTDYYEILL